MISRLERPFFARPPVDVARDLVGCEIALHSESWRIVECEAYGDETDLASHAAVYRRSRGEIMRREPGHLYVYLSYGVHHCLNIVAHEPGEAGAVLIRALESRPAPGFDPFACSGPGRLTRVLGVDLAWDDLDACSNSGIFLIRPIEDRPVASSPRIGITRDMERNWRFFDPASITVSGKRPRKARVVASLS